MVPTTYSTLSVVLSSVFKKEKKNTPKIQSAHFFQFASSLFVLGFGESIGTCAYFTIQKCHARSLYPL